MMVVPSSFQQTLNKTSATHTKHRVHVCDDIWGSLKGGGGERELTP